MKPACVTCQHHQPRTKLVPAGLGSDDLVEAADGGTCTEGPQHVDVPAGHFCTGRWRIHEALIPHVGRASPEEALALMRRPQS